MLFLDLAKAAITYSKVAEAAATATTQDPDGDETLDAPMKPSKI